MRFRAGTLAMLVALNPVTAGAQARDSAAATTVAPGVIWRRIVRPNGPWLINVVTIDLRRGGYELRHVRARDALRGREKLSSMVARSREGAERIVVAVNTDFFNLQSGESENNVIIAGEWWKGVRAADSKFDTFPNVRTQFAVAADGRPLFDRFQFDGVALFKGSALPILGLNTVSRTGPEASAIFTTRIGVTPGDTVRRMAEVALVPVGARHGDTLVFVRLGPFDTTGGLRVRESEVVLAGYGARAATVKQLAEGDTVRILLRATSPSTMYPSLSLLVGGWPRILRGGENIAARSASDEATLSGNAEVRHPRSAIGFSRDTSTLMIATVDGRQPASAGMTLVELAEVMREFGAWDALNFDGGGSTTLVVQGRIVNSPSDPAGEREVAAGLLVVRRVP